MGRWTRRRFLGGSAAAAAGAAFWSGSCSGGFKATDVGDGGLRHEVPLSGPWLFRIDPGDEGERSGWQGRDVEGAGWAEVSVPHTWQASDETSGHLGRAWYRRAFEAPAAWEGRVVRIEFEAVFHTAQVWVNGAYAGAHVGKGYTAFALDITALLNPGMTNTVAVRVDNAFHPGMLPRNDSYDWAPDGGITRPVRLILTPAVYLESVWVDARPALDNDSAALAVTVLVRNASSRPGDIAIGFRVLDETTGRVLLDRPAAGALKIAAGASAEAALPAAVFEKPELWRFDRPHLYVLEARIDAAGSPGDRLATTFGVRSIEVRGDRFLLNGEPVRLMGVERMAGSHPAYGMAEPAAWIAHDHEDLKALNCVLTRAHWPQDRRVLDACDRMGILIQLEVPTWGPDTFKGMAERPDDALLANGLEQLREMIGRDRNHPCVFSWGLCNEVGGQAPAPQAFVRAMLREAKRLDPGRLCSYASNSLQTTPERDVAGEMDFVEWNEYYESWFGGTTADLRRNLEAIRRAFPDKPVVISEYGYCACTPDRPEGDGARIRILREHNRVFRDHPWVGGLIFFCYNDYRTHIGDKGLGVLKQRVHGVVDLFGARKPSFEVLRAESSPVESFRVEDVAGLPVAVLKTRTTVPAFRLSGYRLRWVGFGEGGIPHVQKWQAVPDLEPGDEVRMAMDGGRPAGCRALAVDLFNPAGYSTATARG